MTEAKDTFLHWNYFLALEHDLDTCARFIEFAENIYNSYSIEFTHLLLASSSEIDVVAKSICALLDPTKHPERINDYRTIIVQGISGFSNEVVLIPRYNLTLTPWIDWENDSSPDWWKSYNNVKHQRDSHFEEANLKNTLNSMAALLVVVFYFYRLKLALESGTEIDGRQVNLHLQPESRLLRFPDRYYYGTLITVS